MSESDFSNPTVTLNRVEMAVALVDVMKSNENSEFSSPKRLRSQKKMLYVNGGEEHESENDSVPRKKKTLPENNTVLSEQDDEDKETSDPDQSSESSSEDSDDSIQDIRKIREENIKRNKQLWKELGFDDLKSEFEESLKALKPKRKPTKKYEKRPKPIPLLPTRRSPRIQKRNSPNYKEANLTLPVEPIAILAKEEDEYRKPAGVIAMEPCQYPKEKFTEFLNSICDSNMKVDFANIEENLDAFKKSMMKLTLDENKVRKITLSRIYSLAFHPSESKLLLVIGGRDGEVGFWDVMNDSDDCVEVFTPHCRPVNCSSFCVYDPTKLYTTSYDGTVRRADLNKLIFDDIYASDPNVGRNHTTWHCQLDYNTLMVAHGFGDIGFVDVRECKSTRWYSCHQFSIRTVDKHPEQPQYFATASGTGQMRLWDVRHTGKGEPLFSVDHKKSLSGALFSKTGSYLLATCYDDRLRVYNTKNIGHEKPRVITNMSHNNQTGRWLTPFKARWHPQREDVFVVGSMEHPRGIDLVGVHGLTMHRLTSENMTTICSVCVFHPTLNILAGGNASGKAHVYM